MLIISVLCGKKEEIVGRTFFNKKNN